MSVLTPNSQFICPKEQKTSSNANVRCVFLLKSSGYGFGFEPRKSSINYRLSKIRAQTPSTSTAAAAAAGTESIDDSDQLDLVLQEARHRNQPIVIEWMANWCRKCIYLKPKLEKLAAEYETKVKFYCVDVNNVPQGLVKRGNISKMPSIQLWEDGEMKAEVIGGEKAWLVINEVREMIQPSV